jgi:hypothetical protein
LDRIFLVLFWAQAESPPALRPASIVYQDTTTQVGVFNGAATIGSNLAANIDINLLTLATGSAGDSITSLSFLADNFNSVSVQAKSTIYVWAANGPEETRARFWGTSRFQMKLWPNGSFEPESGLTTTMGQVR